MKHKDWPYIKGDKQIIALTKAYEYNKREEININPFVNRRMRK